MKTKLKMLEIRHIEAPDGAKGAYDDIYESEAPIRHPDTFYRWILNLIDPRPGTRLLDVACGKGVLPEMAAERGVIAHGFDLSFSALAKETGDKVYLTAANGERLPYPDEAFDYLTNIGSLEHYHDPVQGALEMARVLAPGGWACVLLPNSFSLANVLFALHNGRTADDGQPIQRYAAQYEWRDLLEEAGLRVERTVKYERLWPRNLEDVARYLRRPKEIGWLLLTPFMPLNLANHFAFLCTRVK